MFDVCQLDDWVLCRIYKKKNLGRTFDHQQKVEEPFTQIVAANDIASEQQPYKFPRTYSLTHLWEFDYMNSISQLLNDNSSYNVPCNMNQETLTNNNGSFSRQLGQVQQPCTDATKFQQNQTIFVNPVYELQ